MDQKDLSGLTFINYLAPGLVTLSAVLITALGARPALDSARPSVPRTERVKGPASSPGLDALKARPWEDPLTAYEDVPNDDDAVAWQERAERRLPLIQEHYARRVKREFSAVGEGKFDKTLCLFALVPSGSDSDTHETRLRIRYALTSALTEQGFSLSYPKRLTYFDINVPIYTRNLPQGPNLPDLESMDDFQWNELEQRWSPQDMTFFDRFRTMLCGPRASPTPTSSHPDRLTTLRIPIKLYQRPKSHAELLTHHAVSERGAVRSVLVYWIDEDRLGRAPLDALTRVFRTIFAPVIRCEERRRDLHLAILGPSSSDILHLMNQELNPTSQSTNQPETSDLADRFGAERASLFSYRATAFSRQSDSIKCSSSSYSPLSFCQFAEEARKKLGLQVRTVIGNDLDLAMELRDELKLRGAWPTKLYSSRRILLLTERDTNYGRNQQNVFAELIRRDASSNNVEIKTYLRGLDGIVPSRDRFGLETQQRSQRESDPDPDSDPSNLAPFSGSSQRDYIARLADDLRRENASWKRNGAQITAIGLLGSDVYDKLLLLRALRRCFPHAYFFTTDLDVELSHPTEKPFTQGLLVASHFGLKAGGSIQESVPTFRDSLQTSAYVAVFSAIKDSEERFTERHSDLYLGNSTNDPNGAGHRMKDRGEHAKGRVHPLLFQIGHSGPSPLPHVRRTKIPELPEQEQDAPPRLEGPPLASYDVHATHQTSNRANLTPSIWWWFCLTVFVVSLLTLIAPVLPPPLDSSPSSTQLIDHWLEPFRLLSRFLCQLSYHATRHSLLSRPFAPMVVVALALSLILIFWERVWGIARQQPLYFVFAVTILFLLVISLVPRVNQSIGTIVVSLRAFPVRKTKLDKQRDHSRDFRSWYVIGPLVIGGLAILAALDHSELFWHGDPVLLFEGISSWPITFIRALALILSCLFCFHVYQRTRDKLQRVKSVKKFPALPKPWKDLFLHDGLFRDLHPIYVNVVLSLVLTELIFHLTDRPTLFFRGPVAGLIGRAMLVFSVVFLLTLNFLIVHLIRDYYTQLRSFTKNQESEGKASPAEVGPGIFVHVPSANVSEVLLTAMPNWAQSQLGAVPPQSKECATRGFGAIAAVQLIARQTDAIGKCLIFPAIVAILLISARFPWLDRSGVPLTLLPLALFLLLFPFGYYFALRRTAQKLRKGYLRWLEHNAEERATVEDAASERVLRQQITQLYSAPWGVYRNWNDDWVFWALLIPLGGSSGLLLLERGASLFGGG